MAKKTGFFDKFQIVIRSSPLALKVIVLAAIVLSVVALTTLRIGILQANAQRDEARAQAAQMEQQIRQTQEKIQQQGTIQGVEDVANGELDLVYPDTVFFNVEENQD